MHALHIRPCILQSADGSYPTVIYSHTNSGSRADCMEILELLTKGFTIFALDFQGSGQSDGELVSLGYYEKADLACAVRYLRDQTNTTGIALWGRSMGAVTTLLLTAEDAEIVAAVVDSPFSRLTELILDLASDRQQGPGLPRGVARLAVALLKRSVKMRAGFNIDEVNPIDSCTSCSVPTLFGHGTEDILVPSHHSQALYEAHSAEVKNLILFDAGHNDVRPSYWYDSAVLFLLEAFKSARIEVGEQSDEDSIEAQEELMLQRAIGLSLQEP